MKRPSPQNARRRIPDPERRLRAAAAGRLPLGRWEVRPANSGRRAKVDAQFDRAAAERDAAFGDAAARRALGPAAYDADEAA